jgi:quercetin 2,3-dioxygenase
MDTQYVAAKECSSSGAGPATLTAYPNREASLGAIHVSRALPIRERRLVGPWCFLDRFGPLQFCDGRPMDVPPHPHIGLQTVSWLLEGEVQHSDSLGYQAVVRPGGVNVMTAGRGIAHAEETPGVGNGRLDGVQLWVALPEADRNLYPSFTHLEQVPGFQESGARVQVFAGSYRGLTSPAPHFSEIIGLDAQIRSQGTLELALRSEFEHAVLLLSGDCRLEDDERVLNERTLYYLGANRSAITIRSEAGGRLLLIGGPPSPEKILMWWNFVARTPEEIAEARADWETGRRFGEVVGEHRPRLSAPDLVHFARPNPMS